MQQLLDVWMNAWRSLGTPPGAGGLPFAMPQMPQVPGMPQMGMAAMNVVTPLSEKGGGVYEGQAKLDGDGAWQLTVTAIKSGAVLATKQVSPNAEGGK